MIRSWMLGLLLAAPVAAATPAENPAAAAKASRAILQRCGAGEAQFLAYSDSDWTTAGSAAAEQAALRQTLGEPMPAAETMVSVFGIGGDLQTSRYSLVLARGPDGVWRGSFVGESQIWIKDAKPSIFPRKSWVLTAEEARRLDAILADDCFYAEPTDYHHDVVPGVGNLKFTMETQTPHRQRRAFYVVGDVAGLTKEVKDLVWLHAK